MRVRVRVLVFKEKFVDEYPIPFLIHIIRSKRKTLRLKLCEVTTKDIMGFINTQLIVLLL